jgi:hypothetical protein
MLEIGILIYVCMEMSRLAESKNLSKRKWVVFTILSWVLSEMLILTIVIGFFHIDNLFFLLFFGILGGFLGYLFAKRKLLDQPNVDVID